MTIPPLFWHLILLICFSLICGCSQTSFLRDLGSVPNASSLHQQPKATGTVKSTYTTWTPANWDDLPGWTKDSVSEAIPALLHSCLKPNPAWKLACSAALLIDVGNDASTRDWAQTHLQPWRVTDANNQESGLLTGYYEPTFKGQRKPNQTFKFPIYSLPHLALGQQPSWSRQQLDTDDTLIQALEPFVIAYLENPIDVMILHIQGSGRLNLIQPDGTQENIRLAYASHNGHPFRSTGKWLIQQGLITNKQASWPGIREWLQKNPRRASEALWSNPRVIFFREEPLADPTIGPKGAQGIPLTPQRSIAIDPQVAPYGTMMWIQSQHPKQNQPLERLVVAQDTGSAIVGAIRADFFWGWDNAAQEYAGQTRHPLKWWILWPIGDSPPITKSRP